MKLHLDVRRFGGRELCVVTLRAGTEAAFSVNYFHDTWHILSDERGARLLSHLLWGLSFQRVAGTLICLHGPHLHPTPFDADPSPPILLIPAHLTPLDEDAFRTLKRSLSCGNAAPERAATVRWRTFGLSAARERAERGEDVESGLRWNDPIWKRDRMVPCGGFICYTAPAEILRFQAVGLLRMAPRGPEEMDYHYLAESHAGPHAEGEVQIFADYRRMCSEASVARREVLEREPGKVWSPDTLRYAVWARREAVAGRRGPGATFRGR